METSFPAALTAPVFAQTRAKAENVPEIPIESVPNFVQLPEGVYLGESMGIARNSKGHVFVYHRRDDTRLFEFDATGKFVREWTPGLTQSASSRSLMVSPYPLVGTR